MYPGRSAWTRGVLALGVGALFLLAWRIDTAGDALSTSTPIDSDRNYFSVAVASSRSSSRRDIHGKKEERPSDGPGIEGQDRQASSQDYSATDQETRTPTDVHRNAEPDGEHEASYSEEISLPWSDLRRNERPKSYLRGTSRPTRDFATTDGGSTSRTATSFAESSDFVGSDASESYTVDKSPVRNLESGDGKNEVDGEATSFSIASSLAPRNVVKNDGDADRKSKSHVVEPSRGTEDEGNSRSAAYSIEKPLPSSNFDKNDLVENAEGNRVSIDGLTRSSFLWWNVERNDKNDGGSKSYLVEGLHPSWSFVRNDRRNDDRKSVSYSVPSSFPIWDVKRNDGESKNYAVDSSLPSWSLEKKYGIKDEHDGGLTSYAVEKSFPLLASERSDYIGNENNGALTSYLDESLSLQNLKKNTGNEDNYGLMYFAGNPMVSVENEDNYESISDPWNSAISSRDLKEETDNAYDKGNGKSINRGVKVSLTREGNDRSYNDYTSTGYSRENSLLPSDSKKIDLIENKRGPVYGSITRKSENYWNENSLRLSNAGKIELIENNRRPRKISITKRGDLASLKDPKRRTNDNDEANYTMFRSEEAGNTSEQDETRFSKDDEETRDAFNGSAVGERSDVKENLSHRVNGQSMNEVGKSLGRSYYSDAGNSLSLTLHGQRGENDDEIHGLAKMESTAISTRYSHSLQSELNHELTSVSDIESRTQRKLLSYDVSSSASKSNEKKEILWNINNEDPRHRNDRSISTESRFDRRVERKLNVGFSDELVGDFHNSDQLSGFEEADREEEYKRDEESISGSADSSRAKPPVLAGMQKDRVLFFRENHGPTRSSAKTSETLGSRKGRTVERNRENILERGTRETRSRDRSPPATDPSVDFREMDAAQGYAETLAGYEITDRRDRHDANVREAGPVSSPLRGSGQLFDEQITMVPPVTDKSSAVQESAREKTFGKLNLRDGFADIRKDGRRLESADGMLFDTNEVQQLAGEQVDRNILSGKFSGPSEMPWFEGKNVSERLNSHGDSWNDRRFQVDSRDGRSSSFLEPRKSEKDETSQKFSNVRGLATRSPDTKSSDSTVTIQNLGREDKSEELNLLNELSNDEKFGTKVASKDQQLSSSFFRKDDLHREKQSIIRRRRYTNYYSPQSATPMAYVHIQPAYPVPTAPAANRKCVQCMFVYKPCSSPPRPPPFKNAFPTNKYQDLALNWHGLKYGCRCNPIGSITTACDIVTGQCQCKPHVTGRQCDQCMIGFWGLPTGAGCAPCGCDPIGAYNSSCHDSIGQCYCKPGVGGTRCDVCLPGYYGYSSNGCQVCDSCVRPGHVCDPDTGRCVCPTLTFGEHCDRCRSGSWDLVPGVGCRPCACTLGSMKPQCDHQGQCPCRIGYDGLRCEKCAKGYYGYPRCRPCSCNVAGTLQCDDETCDCNDKGQCPCKEYVVGRQCNQCKEGTFGLALDNPKGCTECFCFGRTTSCQQAGLSWGQRRLTRPRTLYVNDTINDIIVSKFRSRVFLSPINGGLNMTNGLSTIPDTGGDVTIPSHLYYNYPLYWMLPESFLGDKVVSYGGFLRFTTSTEGGIPLRSTFQYPIVQLQGNRKIVLEYYLPVPSDSNHYEVRFHESLWQLQNRPDYKVTREVLMVALQNLQYILVKASDNAEFTRTTLHEASIDAAVLTPMHIPQLATGVEICKCPPKYNSTSCQDPSIGHYRWYNNTTVTSTIVINLIGEAIPCQCNGRSDICDIETGHCLNCRENTAGPRCDICSDSFYGHPDFGCKPCPCPQADKRFSNTCMVLANTEAICVCKPGYTGRKCERCSSGYYGFPHLPGGKCIPCNCNPAGSLNDECDTETGQCRCRAGSTGRDCSECTAYRHVYINNVCTSCNDNCTGILLDTVAALSQELAESTTHIANGYIPPPWEDLSYIDSNITTFLDKINLRNRLRQRMRDVPWHEYRNLMKYLEMLLRTANERALRADTVKSKTSDLENNIFSAKIEAENLRKYIEDTITLLNQYTNENKRVEIKKALKTAKMILNGIKELNLAKKTMEIERFLEDVAEYTDWLNSLYDATGPLATAQNNAEEYSIKLTDMRNIIENTMETLFTYDGLYNNINQTYQEAKNYCSEIDMLRSTINASLTEGEKLINETRSFIVNFQNNVQDLPELRNKLTYWFDKLSMKEELLYRLNYEYNDTYVIPAIAHVKNLSNYVDQYVSLFSETKNIAASPLKASQAYKNIVDNIRTANITATAAKDISEDTYNKIFPDGPKSKSLLDSAKEILLASSKQQNSANRHGKLVQNASDGLELQKEAVNILKNTLNSTGIRDNQVNIKLQTLQDDSKKLRENVKNILNDNEKVLESIKTSQKLIGDYKEGIANILKPKLYDLKREGDSEISLASEKLTEALSNMKKADAKLISLSNAAVKRKNEFDKWNDTLTTKLQNLKDKIAEARNTADGIRVSLKSAEGKECSRSYRPPTLQPSSMNSIIMTFALPKGKKEGPLFYLPSSINDDFLALEIIDRRVRFMWNVGGGTGILTHPEVIQSGDLLDDRFWYRIEAERVRHLGKLYVRKQASTTKEHPPIKNSTDSEYGRFDITSSDRVWIGKIPITERRRTELIASNGLPACVHQVILDGKPIGLWNFITTAPDMACEACVEGVEDVKDDIAYSFNGEGYAVRNRVSSGPYNKYSFGVSISFRTYDENALLFLAINPDNNQHIMIFLREGKVILHIGYGGNVSMEMSSNFKYNNGNWTKVDAFRYYQLRKTVEKCSLSVGGENDKRIGAPTPQPKKEDIPDFIQAKYYIGGVPPSFRAEKLILPSQVSFFGCMSNIIVEEGYDPMAEQYHGVEPTCTNKPLRIVGFYGDGYLQHVSYTLRKINSTMSFSFRTMQENAVLLLSTFEGQEERMPPMRHMNDDSIKKSYYSICIINGQVQVRLNAGRGELTLQSNDTFNDGRYHSVTVIKRRKDIELRIDDAYQSAGKLPTSAAIKAPEETGGLFFGGLPVLINNTNMISTTTPLYGTIKDAIFNDDIVRFDEAISFEHALIGRSGPSMGKDPPTYTPSASLSRGMSTQPEGCQKVPYYSLEAGALKFGDKPNSHTQLYLNFKKFWEKKYAIEFDFRTYYPNGLLFITPGLRPKHYLMVVIRDGQLLLLVKSKQKKEILFKTPFNDGNWHHVVISHDERKLTLLVDSQTPRTIKVPRKIGLASMMYIGGLPESGTPIPEQVVVKLETLKGCIRGLRINGNVYDMVGSTSRAYQVGQCFPNVESGAYFQDEAYAIYKRNFELGAVLELQLEFRTSELSGVLLSITAPGNSPSLSLELNNGKVIMSGDLGDNNPLYVEQRFNSPYTICDNRWHRIQAVYNDEELALKVDELDQKYGLPANVNYHIMDATVSRPLYIGGLPASAPKGTLITRDHFNGCIRNVMIGGERRDWTDMDELHNIHLSSCPVQ